MSATKNTTKGGIYLHLITANINQGSFEYWDEYHWLDVRISLVGVGM